jgi:hypothetical protein
MSLITSSTKFCILPRESSVGYSQPWEFVVIRDPQVKQSISASFERENKNAAGAFGEDKKEVHVRLKLEGILKSPPGNKLVAYLCSGYVGEFFPHRNWSTCNGRRVNHYSRQFTAKAIRLRTTAILSLEVM